MATIAENLQTIIDSKAAIKDAIEAKGVAVGDAPLTQYASKIEAIEQGGEVVEEAPENDVNFYDYDGFRVASYSIEEAKALTQEQYDAILPPTHEGLIFQEWNWTLEDIQTHNRQYADIGANYITSDGKTHLKIIAEQNDVVVTFRGTGGTLFVDWGDNSGIDSYSYTASHENKTFTHTYIKRGAYSIVLNFEPSKNTRGFGLFGVGNATTTGWIGVAIYEILCGNYFNTNTSISGFIGYTDISKMTCVASIPINPSLPIISCKNSTIKCVVIPRNSNVKIEYEYFSRSPNTKIAFPKTILQLAGTYIFNQSIHDRLVLPECSDLTSIDNTALLNWEVAILSLPMSASFTTSGRILSSSRLCYIDIAQGWTPNVSLQLKDSTKWSAYSMVKFFNKLGTTTDAITLTFGSTNLNKLTAEEKAIATNKGYTLA